MKFVLLFVFVKVKFQIQIEYTNRIYKSHKNQMNTNKNTIYIYHINTNKNTLNINAFAIDIFFKLNHIQIQIEYPIINI
jgi:hypothetical protein